MIESPARSNQVDRYLRGELDAAESAAFEVELLESTPLQDALEAALGVRRILELERGLEEAKPVTPSGGAAHWRTPPSSWKSWGLAASLLVAAVTGSLWWRAEAENMQLHTRITELDRPVSTILSVPLDVMRSSNPGVPDAFIRKPQEATVLILDLEVAERLAQAPVLELELRAERGDELARWSAAPDADGRIQIAHRADLLPDGRLTLRISDPASGNSDMRLIELLPAR
jgi:hypothetical protein